MLKIKFLVVAVLIGAVCSSAAFAMSAGPFAPDANTVALWHMDNPTPLADLSGNGNMLAPYYGTPDGTGPILDVGRFNDGYTYNGADGAIVRAEDSPSLEALSMLPNQTYELSVKLNRVPLPEETEGFMLLMRSWGTRITVSPGGSVYFKMGYMSAPFGECFSDASLVPGVWYHLAMTLSGGVMKAWVNGVQQASTAAFTPHETNAYPISIGATYYGGLYGGTTDGVIDEVRFSGSDRSSTATLQGHVTLQNYSTSASAAPVAVKVELIQNAAVVRTAACILDGSGNFSVDGIDAGTYDVAVKAASWLRQIQTNQSFTGGANTDVSFTLTNGDLDGDNEVTSTDLSTLLLHLDAKGQ